MQKTRNSPKPQSCRILCIALVELHQSLAGMQGTFPHLRRGNGAGATNALADTFLSIQIEAAVLKLQYHENKDGRINVY